ncbi:MAG: hypothetical protein Kow0089_17270 [Desulfobulbaceae bacterium]
MSDGKRYQANPVVSCGREADGGVLYNPDTDRSSIINLTGLEIWSFLQEPRTTDEIVHHLSATYKNVRREQALEDVHRFLEALAEDFLTASDDR